MENNSLEVLQKRASAFRAWTIIVSSLIIYSFIVQDFLDKFVASLLLGFIFNGIIVAVYFILNRVYLKKKTIRFLPLSSLALAFGVLLCYILAEVFNISLSQKLNIWMITVFSIAVLIDHVFIFSTVIQNIFNENSTISERLWGSMLCFLAIGMAFADIYNIILLQENRDLYNSISSKEITIYFQSITFSMTALANLDPIFSDPPLIMVKLGVIESLASHLFVVIIIGRLLVK